MLKQNKCVPCEGGIPPLSADEISELQIHLTSVWEVFDQKKLVREFSFNVYKDAIKFTNLVATLADEQGHHPFIHINFKVVKIILYTHKIDGLHENDFLMANKIQQLYFK